MLTETDHMLGHKTNQDKSLKIEIMCFNITTAFNLKKISKISITSTNI